MEIKLFQTLEKLGDNEFKSFKWYLGQDDILEKHKGIPRSRLETADRQDTVDQIIQKYDREKALELTKRILKEMDKNTLVRELNSPGPKDKMEEGQTNGILLNILYAFVLGKNWFWRNTAPPAGFQRHNNRDVYANNFIRPRIKHTPKLKIQKCKEKVLALQDVRPHAVDVTLDENTAHPNLILSEDKKQVQDGDVRQQLPYDRRRFTTCVSVLGEQGFSSGKFYFEVQVTGKIAWTLGVAAESIERKGEILVAPDDGFWTIRLRNGNEYAAAHNNLFNLHVDNELEKVGVFVDYKGGVVSFYNADSADHLYSFTGCHFTEKLFPYISPCCNYEGTNSAPLIICPVNQNE